MPRTMHSSRNVHSVHVLMLHIALAVLDAFFGLLQFLSGVVLPSRFPGHLVSTLEGPTADGSALASSLCGEKPGHGGRALIECLAVVVAEPDLQSRVRPGHLADIVEWCAMLAAD